MAQKKPFRVRDRVTKQLLNIFYPGEDINVNTDGTFRSLITALAELQQQINEAGTGNYTKPPGGIPYIDLAESVRNTLDDVDNKVNIVEGKGLSSNDYTNEDRQKLASLNNYNDSELRQQLTRLQNALDALVNGESVTEAIDTFNEVMAFLNGIDTDDPTLFNQLKSLSDAITALQDTLSQKANDNAVVKSISVNGGTPQTPTNGNVEVAVPTVVLDDVPTPNSNNMVKSGGIYNAIANQVSQVVLNNIPADSVAIVDDVVTDDPEQVLSARQGKRLADSIAGLGLEAHEANGTLFISRVADNRSVPPTISYTETSTTITVTAAGVGTITLYRGGTEAANVVSNPIAINKTNTASVVRFYATAQQTEKTVSEMTSLAVTIPAYVAPNPRLTSPANNSSVNITRTASLVSTALTAQSDSPVTIPAGVASQSVAVTVNAPTEVIDFDNLLTDATNNDTFPFQVPASNSLWIRWKKAADNGYSTSNIIIFFGKLAANSANGDLKCYKEGTSNMLFIEDANGDMVSAGAGVNQGTVPAGKWFACWFWGNASQPTHSLYFSGSVTIEYCYAVNYSREKISGDTVADFVQRYAKLPLTIHDASYSNAGSQDLTVTHNGTDTVISNITTGSTITVEAGDTVSISSGSVNFSVDVTSYTAGTATVVVKGADLSQPISIAVSGTGFTCDTVSVTAAEANSTNGKNVVVTYDASGSNTGALTLTSSEFNTVSVTLNGTNA